jgi:hypothetical protein
MSGRLIRVDVVSVQASASGARLECRERNDGAIAYVTPELPRA